MKAKTYERGVRGERNAALDIFNAAHEEYKMAGGKAVVVLKEHGGGKMRWHAAAP